MGKDVKALGVLGITVGILLAILTGITTSGSLTGTANTTVTTLVTKIGTVGNWFGIIVLIIVGAYLLGAFDKFRS
jgi:hypothetical protein